MIILTYLKMVLLEELCRYVLRGNLTNILTQGSVKEEGLISTFAGSFLGMTKPCKTEENSCSGLPVFKLGSREKNSPFSEDVRN